MGHPSCWLVRWVGGPPVDEGLPGIIGATMALAPGTRLGPFEILSLLGVGGMGEVYRARDTSLKRDVAIKVLPVTFSKDSDRLLRFEIEAEAAAALNHPNILSIFHIGEQDGIRFLVTELLHGGTLREHLQNGPLRLRKTVDIAVGVARGLAAAHEAGIVHRDLKPENLFVTKDGQVKILDFGLAKLRKVQTLADEQTATQRPQTTAGQVLGTVGYMSPEQVRGEQADARSDIFALGAILYEMLTGVRAFQKPTAAETMTAILNEDLAADGQNCANAPPAMQHIVRRCLAKNPSQRFQSALDLAFALDTLSDSGSSAPSVVETQSRSRRALPWVVAVVAALIVTAAGGWYLHRFSRSHPEANSLSLEITPLTESGTVRVAAASPDGRYVAYENQQNGQFELRLLQVATKRDVQILPFTSLLIYTMHFSPDGNFIYFLQRMPGSNETLGARGVFKIATLGGPPKPLAKDANGFGVTVSPDGKQIAYGVANSKFSSFAGGEIVSVDPEGENRHVLAKLPSVPSYIEWSPLGDRLAAAMGTYSGLKLVTVELPAGIVRDINDSKWRNLGQPAWSADGTTIYAPGRQPQETPITQIWAIDARTGSQRHLTSSSISYSTGGLSATAAGDLVTTTVENDISLWVSDGSGGGHVVRSLNGEATAGVIWVGKRIVTSNYLDIMVHDEAGENIVTFRPNTTQNRQLAACGPGHFIYGAMDPGRMGYIVRVDAADESTEVISNPLSWAPACNPDGSVMVFTRCDNPTNDTQCFMIRRNLITKEEVKLFKYANGGTPLLFPSAVISPDGKSVFFKEVVGTDPYEWGGVVPITGGEAKRIKFTVLTQEETNADHKTCRCAPDGRSILCILNDHVTNVGNIWSLPLDGKPARKVTNFESEAIYSFDVSADGQLVVARGHPVGDAMLIKNVR